MNKLPEGFTVTFHAGFQGTAANSVSSVEKAVEMNAQAIEMDVHFKPDGTPVTTHDFDKNEDGYVLLDDMLAAASKHGRMLINLDLKSVDNLPAVDALVSEYGLKERAFFTGVGEKWVQTVRQNSSLPYYLNCTVSFCDAHSRRAAMRLIKKVKDCGAVGVNSHFRFASAKFVRTARENGLLVSFWTPSNEKNIIRTLGALPDNITTREPALAEKIIKESSGK